MSEANLTKSCSKCKTVKPISGFYKDAIRKDGMQSRCKECSREAMTKYQKTDKCKAVKAKYNKTAARKATMAKYSKTKKGRAVAAESVAKYKASNPIKTKAGKAINSAIKSGKITKPCVCEQCPSTKRIEGHHDDYALLLVVRWLCSICHNAWHKENGPGLNG